MHNNTKLPWQNIYMIQGGDDKFSENIGKELYWFVYDGTALN